MTGPGWLAALNANSYNPLPPLVPGSAPVNPVSLLGPDGWPIGHPMADWIKNGIPYRTQAEWVRDADWATAEKWATRILAAAITIHIASLFTTGLASGPPDAGDGLAAGVDAFQGASEILGSAGSDPGWQGPAAQSYSARNIEQQARTDQMATLDTELVTLLQTQAAEVEKLRKDMYIVLGTLTAAKPIAMLLYYVKPGPPVGPKLPTVYQIATAAACLTTTTGLLSAQRVRSNKTGAALNNVAESYGHIADAAQAARPLHS